MNSIRLNNDFVKFGSLDLSYLRKDRWDDYYIETIKRSKRVETSNIDRVVENEVHVVYDRLSEDGGPDSFGGLALWAGAMNNIKANVPRTAYAGVVTVWRGSKILHIVPKSLFEHRRN